MTLRHLFASFAIATLTLPTFAAKAEVLASPGDLRIRHDIKQRSRVAAVIGETLQSAVVRSFENLVYGRCGNA